MIKPENRNILWATILVDELARAGVRHAVICPGSRSTPLAVAFSRDDRFQIHTIIDERAAAFFALGIGKASGMPAVVACTSGTAAANFFPAIIEASMSNVPMIVMTADRPHELRDSGANQTIDQVKLYGGYVRWFVDVAPPHANPEDRTLRYLRTTVDRSVAYSHGANGGPVHLNVPFEKPLEPVFVEGDVPDRVWEGIGAMGRSNGAITEEFAYLLPNFAPIFWTDNFSVELWEIGKYPKGLIVCGANLGNSVEYHVQRLSELTGYPIVADGLSPVRFIRPQDNSILGGYETFLQGEFANCHQPQIILRLGALPVGSSILNYLGRQPHANQILITESGTWTDEHHVLTTVVHRDPAEFIIWLIEELERSNIEIDYQWFADFQVAEQLTWDAVTEISKAEGLEGCILADVISDLPSNSNIYVASSNPVRHLDQFVQPQYKDTFRAFGNRGVSGIDGTIASASGMTVASAPPTTNILVIGDTALYHDLNSLHLIRRLNIPLIIVCINNDGGGIFHRLPIANHEPPFRDLFVMPHGLTFEHAAKMFDIPYTLAQMGEEFRSAFKTALDAGGPMLIEVPSDAAKFEAQRKQLIETVAQRIKESGILEKFQASQEKH